MWFKSIAYGLNLSVINKGLGTFIDVTLGTFDLCEIDGVFGSGFIGDKVLLRSLLRFSNQNPVQKKGKLNPDWNFFKFFVKSILK